MYRNNVFYAWLPGGGLLDGPWELHVGTPVSVLTFMLAALLGLATVVHRGGWGNYLIHGPAQLLSQTLSSMFSPEEALGYHKVSSDLHIRATA